MPLTQSLYDLLIGAMIGLARASEGNEDLMTESTHRTLREALLLDSDADKVSLSEMLTRLREEKRKLVPNCFDCAMPCGRTSDFDLRELAIEDEYIRSAKLELLGCLRALAKNSISFSQKLPHCYKALCFIGYDCATIEQIQNLKENLL